MTEFVSGAHLQPVAGRQCLCACGSYYFRACMWATILEDQGSRRDARLLGRATLGDRYDSLLLGQGDSDPLTPRRLARTLVIPPLIVSSRGARRSIVVFNRPIGSARIAGGTQSSPASIRQPRTSLALHPTIRAVAQIARLHACTC